MHRPTRIFQVGDAALVLWAGGYFSVTTGAVSTARTSRLVGLSVLGAAGSVDATVHLVLVLLMSGVGAVTVLDVGVCVARAIVRRMYSLSDTG